MDLDNLDRLINDACSVSSNSSSSPAVRRSPRRTSVCASSPSSLDLSSASSVISAPNLHNMNSTSTKHSRGKLYTYNYRSCVTLLTKALVLGCAIKFIKPDFSLQQSHSHNQSRFLRGNNLLLSDSPFRPRFIEQAYYGQDEEVTASAGSSRDGDDDAVSALP